MANETLSTALAQPFLFAAQYSIVVYDDGNPGGKLQSFPPDPTKYYRTFLARQTGGTGSQASPLEFLFALQQTLGSYWTVALQANGLVRITYLGTSVSGSIVWLSAAHPVAAQCGFSFDVSIAAGGSNRSISPFMPNHFVAGYFRNNDTDWQVRMPQTAGARMGSGQVYVFTSGLTGSRISFDLTGHPSDWTWRQTDAMNSSPAFDDEANWATANAATGVGPTGYSLRQFFTSAPGQRLGVALGNFQALVSGTDANFHDAYLSPGTGSTGEAKTARMMKTSGRLWAWRGIELEWVAKSTR